MTKLAYSLLICSLLFTFCGNQPQKDKEQVEEAVEPLFDVANMPDEPIFDVKTTEGVIRIKLYKETPLHRDNFMKLVANRYYNGILFHRVINDFMIQAGQTGDNPTQIQLDTDIEYTVPAEILPQITHKRGSLAAARMPDHVNPLKASSSTQFYIVHTGNNVSHLNGNYTVFGEVIDGLNVVDIIAEKPVNGESPAQEVKIITILPIE